VLALFAGAVGLVAYTFAGYPAILALLARLRPRPPRADPRHEPLVSLIVVAYDEADVIGARLENCLALDYPADRLEVLVAADGSADATPEIAAAHPGVRVLHRPERLGKRAAMERAAGLARGEILVFSDANNRYERRALRELVAPFADPAVGVVTGRKAIDDGAGRPLDRAEGLYWRYESRLKEWESQVGSVTAVAGEILAFRRDAFPATPEGTLNEDLAQAMLAATAGWRVVYAPGALSLERASATTGDEAIRRARLVTGRGQALGRFLPALARRRPVLAAQLVSHKMLRPAIPWALLTAALSNLALARERRWARPALALQAAFYGAAALGARQERRGRRSRLLYLPYWFCRMNLATLEGLVRLATGRREAAWAKVRRG